MNWLIRSATEALDLAEDQRALLAVGVLAHWLAKDRQEIGGARDLISVLTRLAQADRDVRSEVINLLRDAAVGLVPEETAATLSAIVTSMQGRLPELGLLTCRWDQLGTTACADKPSVLHWNGLDKVLSPGGAGAVQIAFNVSGLLDRGLTFEANARIPAELAAAGVSAVRIGLRGRVEAGSNARIPIRVGSIGLSAESDGATHIDWYVSRAQDSFVANSFAAAVGALKSPFDLEALSMAFANDRLLGVNINAGGGFGLGGSVTVGVTEQRFGEVGGKLGVEVGFHSSRRGEFRLSVRPAGIESNDPRAVRVDIGRTKVAADTTSAGVGLTLDLSPLLVDLRPILLNKVGAAKNLLTELQNYIPPSQSQVIRGELTQLIKSRFAAPELRAALGAALGASPTASDLDRLRLRLEGAIDSQAKLWRKGLALSSLAIEIAGQAIDGLPIREADRGPLLGISKGIVEQALTSLKEDLRRELKRRIMDGGDFERLKTGLEKAGEPVSARVADSDSLSTRVMRQLDRFQGILAKLSEAFQHSAEVKINARWRSEERRSRGSSIDQSLLFHPDRPGASQLYQQALTGSLEEVFESLSSGPLGDKEPVTLISGTIQEFANVRKQSGVELTLLDFFNLGNRSLLDADVVVETDASGNIRVCARAKSRWSRWRPTERSDFHAVNVFELASAREARRMNFAMSLSQTHKNLRKSEVRDFFAGLADERIALLEPDDVRTALARLEPAASGTGRSGELRAWLELDETSLLQLLRISKPDAVPEINSLTSHDKRVIYDVAIDAMVAGLRTTGSSTDYRNLEHYLKTSGHGRDLSSVLKEMRVKQKRRKFAPHAGDDSVMVSGQPQYDRLEGIVKRAEGLVDTIESMRAIYFSEPGEQGWSLDAYQQRQEKINDAIIYWVRGQPVDRGWFAVLTGEDSIGPYMLAFFKAIADLSKSPIAANVAPPLLASIVVPRAGRDHEIMLVADHAQPVSAPAAPSPGPAPPSSTPPPTPQSEPLRPPQAQFDTDEQRSQEMPKLIFPLEKKIRTYHTGGRRFGAGRRRTKRLHGGCDLTVPPNTRILAMADGVVRRGPSYFYGGTYALEVVHEVTDTDGKESKILVRYGEINQRVPKGVKPGATVRQGDLIATVGRLNSGSSMLHLEMYGEGGKSGPLTVSGFNKYQRRKDILDPTPELDAAPTWASVKDKAGNKEDSGARAPEKEVKTWAGTADGFKVVSALNVRAKPEIAPGAAPKYRLRPGDKVEVIRDVHGGNYPFGQGDLWFEIRHREQTGFVVAYFVATDYPVAGTTGLDKDAEPGYVSRLESGLNIRAEPNTDAEVLYKLDKGTAVAILSQHTGGVYDANRNDWLRVQAEGQVPGYAAAYYVDVGDPNVRHDTDPDDLDNKNVWERVLLATEWAGASDETTGGQLGRGTPGGVPASERMAQQDLERIKRVAGVFRDVAAKFGLPAALLAGVASRESRCGGEALVNGWGDNGNGFGIMQVDRRSHQIRNMSDPFGVDHVEQATGILAGCLEGMIKRKAGWEKHHLLQGAVAAYNFGLNDVRTETKIDEGTTGDDYGADVLARAKYFYGHPDLHLLRD